MVTVLYRETTPAPRGAGRRVGGARGCGNPRPSLPAAYGLPLSEGVVKKITGIANLFGSGQSPVAGVGAAHRFTCDARTARRQSTGRVAWGERGGPAVTEDLLRRWRLQRLDPTRRRDPTEDDLRWLEAELGAALPPDYRFFLRACGWTGFARARRFPLREAGPFGADAEVQSFLGFSSEMRRDLAFLVSEVYAEALPEGMLPIASDPHENLLLLSVAAGADDTRIWFWDRECRGLEARIDAMVVDLEAEGQDTVELDEDQILRRWEALFPGRRAQPAGFINVYPVAESFATFLASLYEARS